MAFKMKGKSMTQGTSAYKKALVGKQGNLPEGLKSKIEAAPTKMYGKTPAKFSQPGAGGPGGDDPKTAAAKAQGREVGEMNKSSKFHPDNEGKKRGAESGFKATYKEAYKDADKKKYKTFDEFKTAAESYNRKTYGSEEPTKKAKKWTGGDKEELAKLHKENTATKTLTTRTSGEQPGPRTTKVTKKREPSKHDKMVAAKKEGGKEGRKVRKAEKKLAKAAGDTSKRGERKRRKATKKLNKAGIA